MSMQAEIESRLSAELKPCVMQVINESNNHNVPPGSESHFKLVLVSDMFDGKPLLARHRIINRILESQIQNGIHALTMHTYTPSEWDQRQEHAPASPACHGGGR